MRLSGRGAIIAFAAAAGDTAADGSGGHSPFTAALLQEIAVPDVEVGLMFRRVARHVRDETRGDQHPELLVRLVDEVYLNRTAPEATPVAAAAPAEPQAPPPAAAPPGEPAVAVAQNDRQVAVPPGREASADKRFFGARVVHTPPWVADLKVPQPSGWRSAAPQQLDEADGNEGFATAQPVPLAASLTARIAPLRDQDWFRVEVPSAGELRLDVDPAPANLDLAVQVLNADKTVIGGWTGAPGAGKSLSARFALPAAGAYWIDLADGNNDAESSDTFAVNVDFVAADDPMEPNDSLGAATPLPQAVHLTPTIYPLRDNDWYKVWVDEPGLLQLSASAVPQDLDVVMRVLDLNDQELRGWTGPPRRGGDTKVFADLPRPGG
jgi:hypothetical protein